MPLEGKGSAKTTSAYLVVCIVGRFAQDLAASMFRDCPYDDLPASSRELPPKTWSETQGRRSRQGAEGGPCETCERGI